MRSSIWLISVLAACLWLAGCSDSPTSDGGSDLDADADGASDGDDGSDAGADGDAETDGGGDGSGFEAPPCCAQDLSCPAGMQCLSRADVGNICVETAGAGACWSDEDCPPTLPVCSGMTACACDEGPCAVPVTPGTCGPGNQPSCCWNDDACPGDLVCAHPPANDGRCVPPPPPDGCYSFIDCPEPGYIACEGAVLCACHEVCTYTPGTCLADKARQCCGEDADCLEGRCHHGACLADAPSGCYSDSDCPLGTFCSGETVCHCGIECQDGEDIPGECLALPSGCCNQDSDCGTGEVCRGADPELVPGRCLPDAADNGCWSTLDCPESNWPDFCCYCSGASFCPCVEACPDCGINCGDDTLGWCNCGDCI